MPVMSIYFDKMVQTLRTGTHLFVIVRGPKRYKNSEPRGHEQESDFGIILQCFDTKSIFIEPRGLIYSDIDTDMNVLCIETLNFIVTKQLIYRNCTK